MLLVYSFERENKKTANFNIQVRDTSSRTLDILRPYSQRPQSSRAESIDPASLLPSLAEIDELLHLHRHTAEILERIRSAAISHEHSLNEQRSHQQIFKTDHTREKERMSMYGEEYKNGTVLAGGNNTHIMNGSSLEKKRRVRWTFPSSPLSMIYHLHSALSSALANLQIVESCPTWPLS